MNAAFLARRNEEARRGVPMSAADVRTFIEWSDKADKRATRRIGERALLLPSISEEGKAVWREYLAK